MKKTVYFFLTLILCMAALPCTAQENTANPWLKDVPPGYIVGRGDESGFGLYLNLFDELVYKGDPTTGNITYYVYDPVKHGADPNKTYPVLYWFHGAGMSFTGKRAISIAGAEQYAGPEYQSKLGGAYIIFPLANERTFGGWLKTQEEDTPYANAHKGLLGEFINAHRKNAGKVVVAGISAGGYAAWRFIINNKESVNAALVMSAPYYPPVKELERLEKAGLPILVLHAYHDELATFNENIQPVIEQYVMRSNIDFALLEWLMDHDHKTIVSFVQNNREQGQHSTPRAVTYNMLYDDGTPYSKAAPDGFIAWLLKTLGK
jgi:predicted peptidase